MDKYEQCMTNILDVSKKIFELNEKNNMQSIFKGKTFIVMADGRVFPVDNNSTDNFYYFEHPKIDGVIIKKDDGDYCIKATVQYINSSGNKRYFAKIRIDDYYGEIHLKGRRIGSWEMDDFDDVDFVETPDLELPIVLNAMENSLYEMYDELYKNNDFDMYESKLIKKFREYNHN